MQNVGIYKIYFIGTNKVYIGSSVNIQKRIYEHLRTLQNHNHANRYLQRAYNKYGLNSFKYEILELCEKNLLKEREQFWINKFISFDPENGYNLVPIVTENGTRGYKYSTEQKIKHIKTLSEKVWIKTRKTFKFLSPDGKLVVICGLRQFCLKNNLPYRTMLNIHNNIGCTCRGWRKYFENGYKRIHRGKNWLIISPHNKTIKTNNLKNFCIENKLSYSSMRKLGYTQNWHIINNHH